jgi:predicted Ser/Thr protein kinase
MRTRIGRYRVDGALGEGGMGVVYAAHDEELGRDLAVKVLREIGLDPGARERFRREARAAAAVSHPNICHIYDVGEDAETFYIAMERLEGEPLSARLARGPMTVQEAIPVALGVLSALEALHARGIVHRDLKPANVFLTPHGVKLLDFGLAHAAGFLRGNRPGHARDGHRRGHGHAALHVARATAGTERGPGLRPVCLRRDAVRDGQRAPGVRWPDHLGGVPRGALRADAGADGRVGGGRAGPGDRALPREAARGPLPRPLGHRPRRPGGGRRARHRSVPARHRPRDHPPAGRATEAPAARPGHRVSQLQPGRLAGRVARRPGHPGRAFGARGAAVRSLTRATRWISSGSRAKVRWTPC